MKLLVVVLLFGIMTSSSGQDTTLQEQYLKEQVGRHSFDDETWKKSTENLDYSDKRPPPKEEEEPKAQKPPVDFSFSDQTIRVIAFAVLFLVLIIILMKAFDVNIFSLKKKIKEQEYSVEDFSDQIPESALERMLREALERRDFRMAIRIYYLMVIKMLSEKKLISWQKEKTNFTYLGELRGKQQYHGFREATLVFERIWYGDHSVDENYFTEASRRFKGFLEELK